MKILHINGLPMIPEDVYAQIANGEPLEELWNEGE